MPLMPSPVGPSPLRADPSASDGEIDPLSLGFACAALEPGLRGILVFDCSSADLEAAAQALGTFIEAVARRAVERTTLMGAETEEQLWCRLVSTTPVSRIATGRRRWYRT